MDHSILPCHAWMLLQNPSQHHLQAATANLSELLGEEIYFPLMTG